MSQGPRILVIRFSSIGDIVLTTPVYRILKKQLDAEVHLLTKRSFAFSIKHNPYIDEVHTIERDVREVLPQLRKASFDHVIDLHNNLRSLQVKRGLRLPSSSVEKLNMQKWLLVNFKYDAMPAEPHMVYRNVATCQSLGAQYDGLGMDFTIAPEDELDLVTLSGGALAEGAFVAIAIGASKPTKALESDQIDALIAGLDCPVALVGGPAEAKDAERLATEHEYVYTFAGSVSLQSSAFIVKRSAVLISPDTGMMHICAALDHPVISVWGNTVPRFGMTPFYPDRSTTQWHAVETAGLSCRPCSKIGYNKCPRGHFRCIRNLDIDEVIRLARRFVNA